MTFNEYVSRQKSMLRDRHTGEEFLIINGESIPLRSADEIAREIEDMPGFFNRSVGAAESCGRGCVFFAFV